MFLVVYKYNLKDLAISAITNMLEREPSSPSYQIEIDPINSWKGDISLVQETPWEGKIARAVIGYQKEWESLILNIAPYEIQSYAPFLIQLLEPPNLSEILNELMGKEFQMYTSRLANEIWQNIIKIIIKIVYEGRKEGLKITITPSNKVRTSYNVKIEKPKPAPKHPVSTAKVINWLKQLLLNILSPWSKHDAAQQRLQQLLNRLQQIDPCLASKYENFINQILNSNGQ